MLVLHNAAFDVPLLYQNGVMGLADIAKVHDTVIYARMAYPTPSSTSRWSRWPPPGGIPGRGGDHGPVVQGQRPHHRRGFIRLDKPIYRLGAMASPSPRSASSQIQASLEPAGRGHLFDAYGVDSADAVALMEREQEVNRSCSAGRPGPRVDTDHLATYQETHARELTAARDALAAEDLDPRRR